MLYWKFLHLSGSEPHLLVMQETSNCFKKFHRGWVSLTLWNRFRIDLDQYGSKGAGYFYSCYTSAVWKQSIVSLLNCQSEFSQRTKHFETDFYYVCERVELGSFVVKHIPSNLKLLISLLSYCPLIFFLSFGTNSVWEQTQCWFPSHTEFEMGYQKGTYQSLQDIIIVSPKRQGFNWSDNGPQYSAHQVEVC